MKNRRKQEGQKRRSGAVPGRMYKSRLFEMIFREKRELLDLYNAVNGTDYIEPELLEVNTLENAIYMSMHNDLSFIIDARLNLYEHQSTYSPNLPLRYLMYISDLYSKITKDDNLYSSKPVKIPTPRFLIFYNGVEKRPEVETLLLSDLFTIPDAAKALELKAVMLNINTGCNESLLSTCKTLGDYAEYTCRVRTYAKSMNLEDAVEKAITECIQENILADFLRRYRAEAKKVSIYEYNEEKHMRFVKEEGWEEGERCFANLTQILLGEDRKEDLMRATVDKEFREKLYLEYQITGQ